ncbi:hypothetical protein C8T65DRAFT_696391, partial [Cerioporus squamosus]
TTYAQTVANASLVAVVQGLLADVTAVSNHIVMVVALGMIVVVNWVTGCHKPLGSFCLRKGRNDWFASWQVPIVPLMFYTINTGFLTSNVTMGKWTNLYVLFYYVGARLYTVCMLASLNAREALRDDMSEATCITTLPHFCTVPEHRGSAHVAVGGKKHVVHLFVHHFLALYAFADFVSSLLVFHLSVRTLRT